MAAIEILKRRADFLRLKNGRRRSRRHSCCKPCLRMRQGVQTLARFGFVSDHAIAARTPDGRKHGGAVKRNRAAALKKRCACLRRTRQAGFRLRGCGAF
jgi:RNase P protein component